MKNKRFVGIISIVGLAIVIMLLVSIISLSTFTNQNSSTIVPKPQSEFASGALTYTIDLGKSLPDTPKNITVYKTVPVQYTRGNILSLAKKFNISPIGRVKEVAEGSSVASAEGNVQAILHNSGFVEYHDTSDPVSIPENLPSDEEAIKIATKFLKDRSLLPEDAEFRKVTHDESVQLGNNGGKNTVFVQGIEVWFGRKLNSYNVEGTQLMVGIGRGGKVVDYFTNWRNYQNYKEMPIKTPDTAFNEMKTKGIPVAMNSQPSVVINNVYLAYQTEAGVYNEHYLKPVWVFKGDVLVDGKSVMPVDQYIPALTDDAVKELTPE